MTGLRNGIRASAALAALSVAVAACGGDDGGRSQALGTPQNPISVQARDAKAARAAAKSGHFNEAHPDPAAGAQPAGSAQAPCALVSAADARVILGGAIRKPVEAPQGPTCIYRTRTGKAFVTLGVQQLDPVRLKPQLRRTKPVKVAGRKAYCGFSGQSTLYVPLSDERLLVVGGTCSVAREFAAKAITQLAP